MSVMGVILLLWRPYRSTVLTKCCHALLFTEQYWLAWVTGLCGPIDLGFLDVRPNLSQGQSCHYHRHHDIFTRDSIYAIARICYRPSVCQIGCLIEQEAKLSLG